MLVQLVYEIWSVVWPREMDMENELYWNIFVEQSISNAATELDAINCFVIAIFFVIFFFIFFVFVIIMLNGT